jgi:hypothetical protein
VLSVPPSGGSEAPPSQVVKEKFPKEKVRSQRRSLGIWWGTELGGLGLGDAGRVLGADVRREDELGELGEEVP